MNILRETTLFFNFGLQRNFGVEIQLKILGNHSFIPEDPALVTDPPHEM